MESGNYTFRSAGKVEADSTSILNSELIKESTLRSDALDYQAPSFAGTSSWTFRNEDCARPLSHLFYQQLLVVCLLSMDPHGPFQSSLKESHGRRRNAWEAYLAVEGTVGSY